MFKKILIIISIVSFVSLVVYVAIIDYKNQNSVDNNMEQKQSIEKPQTENCIGTIEGELSYPSEIVPNGSIVCAKNLGTNNYYCTPNQVIDSKYRNKKGYRLEVPNGVYVVSSIFPSTLTEQSIKQNLFVEYKYAGDSCGSSECSDDNVSVSVACEKLENINLSRLGSVNIFKVFFNK